MDFDIDMTDELLATPRAVRKRLDLTREVPRAVIEECLELAVQAPTGANTSRRGRSQRIGIRTSG